jgi:hypothetical protein
MLSMGEHHVGSGGAWDMCTHAHRTEVWQKSNEIRTR